MPQKDRYHDEVIRALQKAGWVIAKEQVRLVLETRHLWIDLRAVNELDNRSILVEVKVLGGDSSEIEPLALALGKYILYRNALNYLEDRTPLYMAVPEIAYNGILNEPIGKWVIQQNRIKLIVFNPEREEIVKWSD